MPKTRIGFVGVGFMGQQAHLRNYVAVPDCEVVAISEPREKLRELVAARFQIPRSFATHKEMLEACELDGVVASQPYSRHAILVPDLLQQKIPVFTEKPISVAVATGERLAQCAAENKTLYMVGYHKRSDPAMEYALQVVREWKKSGEFGPMRYIRATMPPGDWVAGGAQGFLNTDEPYPQVEWEAPVSDMDQTVFDEYNAFVNYYIHQVNAIRYFLEEKYSPKYASPSGVLMAGESESGVTVTLEMAPFENTQVWLESYLIAFQKGYVMVELPAPLACQEPGKVTVMRNNQASEVGYLTSPLLPKRHAMLNQAYNFIAAIRGEKPAPCEAAEAVEDLKVAREYIRLKLGK